MNVNRMVLLVALQRKYAMIKCNFNLKSHKKNSFVPTHVNIYLPRGWSGCRTFSHSSCLFFRASATSDSVTNPELISICFCFNLRVIQIRFEILLIWKILSTSKLAYIVSSIFFSLVLEEMSLSILKCCYLFFLWVYLWWKWML